MEKNLPLGNMSSMINGFKLGMVLQVGGMGPICFLLFQLSSLLPLYSVLGGVWAVTMADAIYICISILGIMGIIKQVKNFSNLFKIFSGLIIVLLGVSFCMLVFSEDDTRKLISYNWTVENVFLTLFILTVLNPVTIVCFSGVFAAKLMNTSMKSKQLVFFALGTLLSTPVFLSLVVILGALGASFFPMTLVNILNFMVGLALIYWGIKYIFPNFAKFQKK